ncbi:MAG: carboxypeptidase-like regulatory domain-containing protein, partial [Candidatus Altiarchaeota archaeon]|nr:carboxypeptidase-like regulatory domain-containing protein [Candidatus Altiarchaeota archaeon]
VGCPASNCFCNPDEYWNFYIKSGDDSWSYSPVGFDGGESCSEHYCAEEGDVLGFAYGGYGTEPLGISFREICSSGRRRGKNFDVSISPEELFTGDSITIEIKDSSTGEGIKDVEVDVLNGHKVSGETDNKGRISFKLDTPGVYKLRINARGYNPPQEYMDIEVKPTVASTSTTTSSTSTTSTTTPSSSTTSTTTTTSSTSTSTTSTLTTSTTTTSIPTTTILEIPAGRVVGSPAGDSSLIFLIIFISVALLGVYLKRRM